MEKLIGTICLDCEYKVANVTDLCPSCGSENTESLVIENRGTIYSFTIVHVGFGHMASRVPYALAVIDTEDHIKLTTVVEDVPDLDSLKIGDKVRFKKMDEMIGPIFQVV